MKPEHIDLTDSEWRVMEALWASAPLTGRELIGRMEQETGWSRSTTLTLLRRLEDKGAVASDDGGRVKTFRPLVAREDAALRETEDFLHRVYQGSVSLMVSALTKKQALSRDEIDELYGMLKQLEGDEDRD